MRLFLAIDLPPDLKEKLFNLGKKFNQAFPHMKLVEKENLHITLKFLGEVDEIRKDEIISLLRSQNFGEKFSASIETLGVFPNENFIRVLWVGIGEGRENISTLMKKIDKTLNTIGFLPERSYIPHITIARLKQKPNKKFFDVFSKYRAEQFGEINVEKFVLFKSTLTKNGPIYEKIKEWCLNE